MPEMPEVQAHSERMTSALAGATLTKFQLLNFAGLKTFSPGPDSAVGSKLVAVDRRAKYLLLRFDNDHCHLVHLMQGGRLRLDPKQSRKPRNGIARWVFEDQAWLLTEAGHERKAGVWVLDKTEGDIGSQEPLSRLAPEASNLTAVQLGEILSQNSMRVHGLLRSQKVLSGLGRMLANEICFLAGISPFANAAKLGKTEVVSLHAALQEAVSSSLKHERTLEDIGKSAERPSRVHNRSGEPCVNCRDHIATVEYRSYVVYYCPTCQTKGKKLSNNTTSKFLK